MKIINKAQVFLFAITFVLAFCSIQPISVGAALYNDDPEVVRILLDNGANIDARDEYGDTPLIIWGLRSPPGSSMLYQEGCELCRTPLLPASREERAG